jgi:hypothetical protein
VWGRGWGRRAARIMTGMGVVFVQAFKMVVDGVEVVARGA